MPPPQGFPRLDVRDSKRRKVGCASGGRGRAALQERDIGEKFAVGCWLVVDRGDDRAAGSSSGQEESIPPDRRLGSAKCNPSRPRETESPPVLVQAGSGTIERDTSQYDPIETRRGHQTIHVDCRCLDFASRQQGRGLTDQIGRPADQKCNALLHITLDPGVPPRLQEIGGTSRRCGR